MVPLHINIVVKGYWLHAKWETKIIGQYTCILTNNAQELTHPTDFNEIVTQT